MPRLGEAEWAELQRVRHLAWVVAYQQQEGTREQNEEYCREFEYMKQRRDDLALVLAVAAAGAWGVGGRARVLAGG